MTKRLRDQRGGSDPTPGYLVAFGVLLGAAIASIVAVVSQ